MNSLRLLPAFCLLALPLAAQTAPAAPPTISYASQTQLNNVLGQLEQAAQAASSDLSLLRVERWKADSDEKRQVLSNVDSLQRNLQSALPALITQVRAAPEDLNASFKLYRNASALYDVLASVTESAGVSGSHDEAQSLAAATSALDKARRALADRLESLATAKDAELANLRAQVKSLQAATPPAPPKKIIVDDDQAPKKPIKKKAAPKPPAAAPAQPVPSPH
jgi:hypothetical protein